MTPADKLEALEAEIRDLVERPSVILVSEIAEWADRLAAIRAELVEAVPATTVHNADTPGHFAIITPALPAGTKLYTTPPATVPVEALEGLVEKLLDNLTALIAAQEMK